MQSLSRKYFSALKLSLRISVYIETVRLFNGDTTMATEQETQQLIAAVLNNKLDELNRLLEQNSDLIKLQNQNKHTLLHLAAQAGHADIVEALLRANNRLAIPIPDFINLQDKNGNTALHIAAKNNHLAVGEILVSFHAKRDISNNNLKTALDVLPTGQDFYNFSFLLNDPLKYYSEGENYSEGESEIKPERSSNRLKLGLMALGGLLSAGAIGAGIAALVLTLLGISFLPFAPFTMLIGAAVVVAVGSIGLGLTAGAASVYYKNRTADYIELKDSTDAAVNSSISATQGLGGIKEVIKDVSTEQLPTVHSSPIGTAKKTANSAHATASSSTPTDKPQI
jgi:hypothetical protein